MSRFREPQDPDFIRMNTSVGFDRRLWPQDIAQSRAHAAMLSAQGIISEEDRDALLAGLERVRQELEAGSFVFAAEDEDIHMAIERHLTELVGPVGGKLHTARSRNDQVATDLVMYTRESARSAGEAVGRLMGVLVERAEGHLDWAMPGYTHLQRAQPVYLSHHLLAYFWMLARDRERFAFVEGQCARLPLGAGALAGVNFETDRRSLATELSFEEPAPNSIDAVSNRDFALDYLGAASTCATHLSRLGAELVLWSSAEFGFCELPDAWSAGSSIMPQKKNPDAAELLRAKAPRVVAHLAALYGVMHALPLTYNKDLQEDKENLFDAVDTLELALAAAIGMVEGVKFDRERLSRAAGDELIAATDVADLLVKRGLPFREAHGIVAGLVRLAVGSGRRLSELTPQELREQSELFDLPHDDPGSTAPASPEADSREAAGGERVARDAGGERLASDAGGEHLASEDYYKVLARDSWLESKISEGGTALPRVREQLELARAVLGLPISGLGEPTSGLIPGSVPD